MSTVLGAVAHRAEARPRRESRPRWIIQYRWNSYVSRNLTAAWTGTPAKAGARHAGC